MQAPHEGGYLITEESRGSYLPRTLPGDDSLPPRTIYGTYRALAPDGSPAAHLDYSVTYCHSGPHVRVEDLQALPGHRRQGLASTLMDRLYFTYRPQGGTFDHGYDLPDGAAWHRAWAARPLAQAIRFRQDDRDTGGRNWPVHVTLTAEHPQHGDVGTLKYWTSPRGARIRIDDLRTEHGYRRQGVASALMDELQRRHPGAAIRLGEQTPKGRKWRNAYIRGKKVARGRTDGPQSMFGSGSRVPAPVPGAASCSAEEYGMPHRPDLDGPPLHDMLEDGMMPADFYDSMHQYNHYSDGSSGAVEAMSTIRRYRGRPDKLVTIWRGAPALNPESRNAKRGEINNGDWIALTRQKALAESRETNDPPSGSLPASHPARYHIWWARVPARHVRNAAGDLTEWGYSGPDLKNLPHASELCSHRARVPRHAPGSGTSRPRR